MSEKNQEEKSLEEIVEQELEENDKEDVPHPLERYGDRIVDYVKEEFQRIENNGGVASEAKVSADEMIEQTELTSRTQLRRAVSTLGKTEYVEKWNRYRFKKDRLDKLQTEIENLENQPTIEEEEELVERYVSNHREVERSDIEELLEEKLDYEVTEGIVSSRIRRSDIEIKKKVGTRAFYTASVAQPG
ncbi:MAG: hypothetical protein ABEJ83_01970 [Candidatus Nanohaloarchaea archaeon]